MNDVNKLQMPNISALLTTVLNQLESVSIFDKNYAQNIRDNEMKTKKPS